MAHVIRLALVIFMSSFGVKGRTKSSEAHKRDQQCGEKDSIDIGNSQRLRKEGNARINKVSAMRQGLAKIIEKERISWYFESPEIILHIAENACFIDYADTRSLKRVHWLSKSQSPHCHTSDYSCEDKLELHTGVTGAGLPTMGIHTLLASKFKYTEYWPLFTTEDDWTIVKYVSEVLRPFQYGTLWMSKRYAVTLCHVITVYNEMFNYINGIMQALAKKNTQLKKDLFFAVKLARRKLSKYYAEVTPTRVMLLISAHIQDPFRKLRSFRRYDKGLDTNPEDETSYTSQ